MIIFNQASTIRYLIFFDDGCTQYVPHQHVRLVVKRGPQIWDDCHQDIREFVRSYLDLYPENPMVRLAVSQKVKTEWNSKLWRGKFTRKLSTLACSSMVADEGEGSGLLLGARPLWGWQQNWVDLSWIAASRASLLRDAEEADAEEQQNRCPPPPRTCLQCWTRSNLSKFPIKYVSNLAIIIEPPWDWVPQNGRWWWRA